MKESFRQSMAWLHTWSGLLVGWVLFMVFSCGTASYFRDEITLWMKPELHQSSHAVVEQGVAAAQIQNLLQQRAPASPRWFITMPTGREPAVRASWAPPPSGEEGQPRGRRRFENASIDPLTGQELSAARATRGGDFFYRMHFDMHYMPVLWARWIVGICAMFMLVAIISGIVTHKRIFKDFFTFRPGKGQRSWLDAHNATAVLALPYHLMITYTGLVTLMFMYLPQGLGAVYKDSDAFFADLNGGPRVEAKASGVSAPLTPLAPLVAKASQLWDGASVGRIMVSHAGDSAATVTLTQQDGHGVSNNLPSLTFDGVTGGLLTEADKSGAAVETRGVMYGLHIGRFASPLLRGLFFLSGLAGCAMVATGVLLWAVKERPKHVKANANGRIGFGLRLVDGLNLGGIAGLLIAMSVYFWANRLLPPGLEGRPDLEIHCFFTAWGIAAVAALAFPQRWMWRLQLALAGVLFALLLPLNPLTGGAGLFTSVAQGLWPVAGFDLVSLLIGCGLLWASRRLGSAAKAPLKAKLAKVAA
ncbi:PepSY domain-containing protein [Duganella sp. CY15W]|uniref:PepSY-associated TM helix domain-containing protein n=1 Tax=Duganella sp. CY15W TaxID=2692172 RepID=UPI00136B874B|nr:PepSY-associated TM helix domain-containing protein [Duganella sp. CY15W]MYM28535.1 PepSY domain-containing protein [Duganella sp. CY15W]